jgi:hypothetical protein
MVVFQVFQVFLEEDGGRLLADVGAHQPRC